MNGEDIAMTNDHRTRGIEGWEHWLYERLGIDWCGNPGPPGDHLGIAVGEPDSDGHPLFVVRSIEDGAELWIGYRTKWLFHCDAADARRIAWFVLWTWWARGTWFGLRRIIWYWLLRRRLRGRV